MEITKDEERVIEILVGHPPTTNLDGDPIFAVDAAMKWGTAKTKQVVGDLEKRGWLHTSGSKIEVLKYSWQRVKEPPLFR